MKQFLQIALGILSGRTVRVPWSEVADVTSVVMLKRSAPELRFGRGDDRAARIVRRLPGA